MLFEEDLCSFVWRMGIFEGWELKHLTITETVSMTIQFYSFDTPNGRKISVALEEMGLAYDVIPVDIGKDEQFKPDFLKISPNNKIPAIVDSDGPDGKPISVFESGAILIYLAEKTGKFLPAKGAARVAVLEWLMFQMAGFGPIPGQVHHFLGLANLRIHFWGLSIFLEVKLPTTIIIVSPTIIIIIIRRRRGRILSRRIYTHTKKTKKEVDIRAWVYTINASSGCM
jgi:hypothetical protein